MYYIGLDVHKKTISYCIKDVSGQVQWEGTIPATRTELDGWMKTLPHEGYAGKRVHCHAGRFCTALHHSRYAVTRQPFTSHCTPTRSMLALSE
jgi:hypothetical protein